MMIDFPCPTCGEVLSVKPAMAGKKGKCPACAAVMEVPEPELVAAGPILSRIRVSAPAPLAARPAPGPILAPYPTAPRAADDAPGPPPAFPAPAIMKVHVVNVEIPFDSMCWLVFKWTFAALPTAVLLGLLWLLTWLVIAGISTR